MPKHYDATTKRLVETRPEDWAALIGCPAPPGTPVKVIDADLATVTTDADRVLGIGEPPVRLAHIEFESGKDTSRVPERLLRYNVLLDYRYRLPVESAVILLRRESDSPKITGRIERQREDGSVYLAFSYRVVRLWEIDAGLLLDGGIGTLPLAPIAAVTASDVASVIRRMEERIGEEVSSGEEVATLWAATYILMGLKYPPEFNRQLLKGVQQMRESSTYQAILEEGRQAGLREAKHQAELEQARRAIFLIGGQRFGPVPPDAAAILSKITSFQRLESLQLRLLNTASWDELLAQ